MHFSQLIEFLFFKKYFYVWKSWNIYNEIYLFSFGHSMKKIIIIKVGFLQNIWNKHYIKKSLNDLFEIKWGGWW
jgi:hypothetical protein